MQYAQVRPIEHVHPLVRTRKQLDRVLQEISSAPGIVLYTIINKELMAELGAEPERTLMIGDTTHDLQLAANAGSAALAGWQPAHQIMKEALGLTLEHVPYRSGPQGQTDLIAGLGTAPRPGGRRRFRLWSA